MPVSTPHLRSSLEAEFPKGPSYHASCHRERRVAGLKSMLVETEERNAPSLSVHSGPSKMTAKTHRRTPQHLLEEASGSAQSLIRGTQELTDLVQVALLRELAHVEKTASEWVRNSPSSDPQSPQSVHEAIKTASKSKYLFNVLGQTADGQHRIDNIEDSLRQLSMQLDTLPRAIAQLQDSVRFCTAIVRSCSALQDSHHSQISGDDPDPRCYVLDTAERSIELLQAPDDQLRKEIRHLQTAIALSSDAVSGNSQDQSTWEDARSFTEITRHLDAQTPETHVMKRTLRALANISLAMRASQNDTISQIFVNTFNAWKKLRNFPSERARLADARKKFRSDEDLGHRGRRRPSTAVRSHSSAEYNSRPTSAQQQRRKRSDSAGSSRSLWSFLKRSMSSDGTHSRPGSRSTSRMSAR